MGGFCSVCGSEAAAGDRFCQGCGAPVDEQITAVDPQSHAPRNHAPAAAPTAQAYQGPPGRRGSRGATIALLAVVAVAALGAIGVGAYLLLSDGSSEGSSLDDWSYEPGSYDYTDDSASDDYSAYDPAGSSAATDTDAAVNGDQTGGGEELEPQFEAGDYLQLGSFRGDGATREAARLADRGIDAFVIDSDGAAELLPGFQVVVAGPLSGRAERNRILRAGREAGIGGLDKTLTPLTVAPDPTAIAGTFDGNLEQTSPQPRLERSIDATLWFADDGMTGTVTYRQPRCESELSFVEADMGTLRYDETVTSGRCADGGTWDVKPNGAELRVAWNEADSDYFISGDMTGGE